MEGPQPCYTIFNVTLNKVHKLLGVSTVDFEKVNTSWVEQHSWLRREVFINDFDYHHSVKKTRKKRALSYENETSLAMK